MVERMRIMVQVHIPAPRVLHYGASYVTVANTHWNYYDCYCSSKWTNSGLVHNCIVYTESSKQYTLVITG